MADFSPEIWIRSPAIAGKRELGGGLSNAMTLLGQARDEIEVTQTAMGTLPKDTAADVAARLDSRLSPSGVRQGQLVMLRAPNAPGASLFNIQRWSVGANGYLQFGFDGAFTTTNPTITFATGGTAYTAAPTTIIAQFVPADNDDHSLGDIQVHTDDITTTTFVIHARRFDQNGGGWVNATTDGRDFYVAWLALGGSP